MGGVVEMSGAPLYYMLGVVTDSVPQRPLEAEAQCISEGLKARDRRTDP